jgi:Porin subfamily
MPQIDRPIIRAVAVATATALSAAIVASSVAAQTLTPNPQTKWSPPPSAAKAPTPKHVKSCAAFGAGFVNVPGTDACVKIGGFVDTDASTSPGH